MAADDNVPTSDSTHDQIEALGLEMWAWRANRQPQSGDDIPRLRRPPNWLPDFSAAAVAATRSERDDFAARLAAIDLGNATVADRIDAMLLGSLLARVTWELDVLRSWQRNPHFHLHQALGPYFDLLLPPPPFDAERAGEIVGALQNVPTAVDTAIDVLTQPAAPLTKVTLDLLDGIETKLENSVTALAELLPGSAATDAVAAVAPANAALGRLRDHLAAMTDLSDEVAVGRDAFMWYLRNVALVADDPDALVAAARQEWQRALVWERLAQQRAADVPLAPLPASAAEQAATEAAQELEVRRFYERERILTQPDTLRHYLTAPMPAYIEPLDFLGVSDDLTDDDRLDTDGVSYSPEPSADLPYFYAANARDPRAGIIHEGAHYQQLAMSYAHADPIRRRYYDSLPNEGIAFYNEELMLQAGLFDEAPHTRAVVWNFARLRSLRVEVDLRLSLGDLSMLESVNVFVEKVPMDHATAYGETAMYAGNPGLAFSYQIGKLQLMRLIASAIELKGETLSLQSMHDYVWLNGNLPFSLLRWEFLDDRSEIDTIEADPLWATAPPKALFDR